MEEIELKLPFVDRRKNSADENELQVQHSNA